VPGTVGAVGPAEVGEAVLAVTEEGEVVVGQPLQQRRALLDLLRRQRGRVVAELGHDLPDLLLHAVPVLDGLAHVEQHLAQPLLDRHQLLGLDLPVDLDVHPRLPAHVGLGALLADLVALVVTDLHQVAGDVAPHQQLRVDDHVDVATLGVQRHRHRVDEEGHVVGDDLHDRVPAGRPAVLVDGGGEDPDVGGALRPLRGQGVLAHGGAVDVDVGALDEVLDGHVAVVLAQVGLDGVARRAAAPPTCGGHRRSAGDEFGLGFLVPGRPVSGQRSS
jgi:hypothetical protein